jgi:hypothetical protein
VIGIRGLSCPEQLYAWALKGLGLENEQRCPFSEIDAPSVSAERLASSEIDSLKSMKPV